jgi:hypothetical protein
MGPLFRIALTGSPKNHWEMADFHFQMEPVDYGENPPEVRLHTTCGGRYIHFLYRPEEVGLVH